MANSPSPITNNSIGRKKMMLTLFKGNWRGIGRHIYLRPIFGGVISATYPGGGNSGFETRGWGVTLHTGKASHHFGLTRIRFLWATP